MHASTYLAVIIACLCVAGLAEHAERRSRIWCEDRMLLRYAGAFYALAAVSACMAWVRF